MKRRTRAITALCACTALSLSLFAVAATGAKKAQRVGTSTQVETSAIQKGKKKVVVNGVLQSSLARCERQRSVLLYEVGPTGDFVGGAIGHGVSDGGSTRGQVTIQGTTPKKIKPGREFRLEAVGRTVKVKGKTIICKRGVSVAFPGDFG
jgi:hypothetical protein